MKCGLAVSAADGNINDSEMALINEMAQAMEMSSSHLNGIIQDMAPKENAFSEKKHK